VNAIADQPLSFHGSAMSVRRPLRAKPSFLRTSMKQDTHLPHPRKRRGDAQGKTKKGNDEIRVSLLDVAIEMVALV
jgi:hypothetical protein